MASCYKVILYGATGYVERGKMVVSNGVEYPGWKRFKTFSWTIGTIPDGYYAGMKAYFPVYDGVVSSEWGCEASTPILDNENPNCPVDTDPHSGSFDCINGNCLKNAQGKGYFKSFDECQQLCSFSCSEGKVCVDPKTFCPPGHVCLESTEYSQIVNKISEIDDLICS